MQVLSIWHAACSVHAACKPSQSCMGHASPLNLAWLMQVLSIWRGSHGCMQDWEDLHEPCKIWLLCMQIKFYPDLEDPRTRNLTFNSNHGLYAVPALIIQIFQQFCNLWPVVPSYRLPNLETPTKTGQISRMNLFLFLRRNLSHGMIQIRNRAANNQTGCERRRPENLECQTLVRWSIVGAIRF
jgi:hypothetical protein